MSYNIDKLQSNLTNEFKKNKKNITDLQYFYRISIIKTLYNNNYLIYIKNKQPYIGEDIYIGYVNYIDKYYKIDKKYINMIKKYLF
jgi:hypothetical protein